jgi:hypothetical protein
MLGQDRKEAAFPQGWQGNLLRRYQEHLIKVRGLAPATISQHLMYTRLMLNRLGITGLAAMRAHTGLLHYTGNFGISP